MRIEVNVYYRYQVDFKMVKGLIICQHPVRQAY